MRHRNDLRAIRRLAALFFLAMTLMRINTNAQAVRYDNFASTTSAQCSPGKQCPLNVLPGTTVNLCTGTVSTLTACLASPATTYTDSTLGTPCPTTAQLTPATGGACLSTADNQGGYGFWASAGVYSYYLRVPVAAGGGTYGPYSLSIGASAGCPSNATCDANFATLALGCSAAGVGTLYVTRAWNGLASHTFSCQMQFLSSGKIQPASGQVITISGPITAASVQIFDTSLGGPGSILITAPILGGIQPNWFGAVSDPTGATGSESALASAVASLGPAGSPPNTGSPGYIRFPSGTYNAKVNPFTFNGQNLHASCDPGTVLQYTGSGSVNSVVLIGNYTGGSSATYYINLSFEGCTVIGNANVTVAGVLASNSGYVRIENVNVKNAPACFVAAYQANTTDFKNNICSQYNGTMTIVPSAGIWYDHSAGGAIESTQIEDLCSTPAGNRCNLSSALAYTTGTVSVTQYSSTVTGSGTSWTSAMQYGTMWINGATPIPIRSVNSATSITLEGQVPAASASGLSYVILPPADGIRITASGPVNISGACNSGGNQQGIFADFMSSWVVITGCDNESDFSGEIVLNSNYSAVHTGEYVNYVHFMNRCAFCVADAVGTSQMTVDHGTVNAKVENISYANLAFGAETITDLGSCTTLHNNRSAGTGFLFPIDQDGCNYTANSTTSNLTLYGTNLSYGGTTNNAAIFSSIVNTSASGNTVSWVSGSIFSTIWSGTIHINGSDYIISSCTSTIACTLTSSPGNHSSVALGSVNNALSATMANATTGKIQPITNEMIVFMPLTNSLQIGANTLNLNGTGAVPVLRQFDGGNLGQSWIGSGLPAIFVAYGVVNCTAPNTPSGCGVPQDWILMGSQ